MRVLLYILCSLFFLASLNAQDDSSFRLVKTYRGDIASAAMDNLDNLYIISPAGQIRKFNAAGDSVGVYNQVKNFGKLYSIDVSNPLKILLFYKDFSTLVVLDRFLANVASLDLRRYSILQPAAAGVSYDNNIWIFDEWDNKLKRINEQGQLLLETTDLRTVFDQVPRPQKIMSDNGLVYLADTARGVFVFDNYGAFKKRIPVKNWQSIAVNSNNVISIADGSITFFNTNTFAERKGRIPFFKPYLHSFSTGNKLVSFSSQELQVYQYRF